MGNPFGTFEDPKCSRLITKWYRVISLVSCRLFPQSLTIKAGGVEKTKYRTWDTICRWFSILLYFVCCLRHWIANLGYDQRRTLLRNESLELELAPFTASEPCELNFFAMTGWNSMWYCGSRLLNTVKKIYLDHKKSLLGCWYLVVPVTL